MLLCAGGMLFAFALFKNAVPDPVLWIVEALLLFSLLRKPLLFEAGEALRCAGLLGKAPLPRDITEFRALTERITT